jgi:hypothetical protein
MYTATINIFQLTFNISFIEFPKFVPDATINGLLPAAIFLHTPGNSTA